MARRSRSYRLPGAQGSTDAAPQRTSPQRLIEDLSHDLKLLDIKRVVIRQTSGRIPFLYVGLGVFGLMLALSVLGISILGMFLFGSLFSGVLASTFGPVGAVTERKKAYEAIAQLKNNIGEKLYNLPPDIHPKVFGFRGASKSGVSLTETAIDLKSMNLDTITPKGDFPFAPYKLLSMVFAGSDGLVNLDHPAMKAQYWLGEARLKGIKKEQLTAAVSGFV